MNDIAPVLTLAEDRVLAFIEDKRLFKYNQKLSRPELGAAFRMLERFKVSSIGYQAQIF